MASVLTSKEYSSNSQIQPLTSGYASIHSSNRPKQQQHKNLDKIAASLNSSKRSQLKNKFSSNHLKSNINKNSIENYDKDDSPITETRNRLLTLSATDSVLSTPYAKTILSQNHTIFLPANNNQHHYHNRNYEETTSHNPNQTNTAQTKLSRRNTRSRRQQYAQLHSKSLEYSGTGEDSPTSDEENKPIEFSPEIMEAADKVTYITNHIKNENYYEDVNEKLFQVIF